MDLQFKYQHCNARFGPACAGQFQRLLGQQAWQPGGPAPKCWVHAQLRPLQRRLASYLRCTSSSLGPAPAKPGDMRRRPSQRTGAYGGLLWRAMQQAVGRSQLQGHAGRLAALEAGGWGIQRRCFLGASPGKALIGGRHPAGFGCSYRPPACSPWLPCRQPSQPWLRATPTMPRLSTRRWRKCECGAERCRAGGGGAEADQALGGDCRARTLATADARTLR